MKRLLLPLTLFLCSFSYAQNKQYSGVSGYQVDKTLNGTKKSSSNIVNITFTDPKSVTNLKADFDDLPIGEILLLYRNLTQPIVYRIKYFGTIGSNKEQEWYGVVNDTDDYNCVLLKMNNEKITKDYKYVLTMAKMDVKTKRLITYTSYYCNLN